jgi:hypothetical protein
MVLIEDLVYSVDDGDERSESSLSYRWSGACVETLPLRPHTPGGRRYRGSLRVRSSRSLTEVELRLRPSTHSCAASSLRLSTGSRRSVRTQPRQLRMLDDRSVSGDHFQLRRGRSTDRRVHEFETPVPPRPTIGCPHSLHRLMTALGSPSSAQGCARRAVHQRMGAYTKRQDVSTKVWMTPASVSGGALMGWRA